MTLCELKNPVKKIPENKGCPIGSEIGAAGLGFHQWKTTMPRHNASLDAFATSRLSWLHIGPLSSTPHSQFSNLPSHPQVSKT
jgi:hypothetical protein